MLYKYALAILIFTTLINFVTYFNVLKPNIQLNVSYLVNPDRLKELNDIGYLHLNNVIDPVTLNNLDREYNKLQRPFYWKPVEALFLYLSQQLPIIDSLWTQSTIIANFWSSEVFKDIFRPIFKNETRLLTDLLITLPKDRHPKYIGGWHYDTCSYDIIDNDDKGITAWIPLDNINSNQGGSLYLVSKNNTTNDCLFNKHKLTKKCLDLLERKKNVFDFKKGDILLFDSKTFHKTQTLLSESKLLQRRTLVGRFVGKSTFRETDKGRGIRQRKNNCHHNLMSGDPLKSDCFPLISKKLSNIGKYMVDTDFIHIIKEMWRLLRLENSDLTDC